MIVRCGACRTQFEVPGAGRFACPVCGSVNVVRGQAQPAAGGYPSVAGETHSAPPAEKPSPRVTCPECGFSFIVGDIAMAVCPNCGSEVKTGRETAEG